MPTWFRHALCVAPVVAVVFAAPLRAAAAAAEGAAAEGAATDGASIVVSNPRIEPAHLHLLQRTAAAFSFHMPAQLIAARDQAFGLTPGFAFTHFNGVGSFGSSNPLAGMLGLAHQLPLGGPMRRFAETDRWNTSDSSRPNDFAICYRLSRIMGVQIIPGDLTPSKLPTPRMLSVKTYGNGMGVMAGLTLRVGKH